MRRLLLTALLFVLASTASFAHTRSESFSSWQVSEAGVTGTITFTEREATRIPFEGDEATTRVPRTLSYLATKVGVARGGDECDGGQGPRALPATGGFMRIEFAFACPEGDGPLTLTNSAFVDLIATHMHMARVKGVDGGTAEFLFSQAAPRQTIQAGKGNEAMAGPAKAGFFAFIPIGMEHILSGLDHLVFLLGVMLIAGRGRDIALAVTGFTIGHSITLALATLKIISPDGAAVEAAIGFTIALVAMEFLGLKAQQLQAAAIGFAAVLAGLAVYSAFYPWGLPSAWLLGGFALFAFCYLTLVDGLNAQGGAQTQLRWLRLTITSLFGLIHGFGFAGNLLSLNLDSDRIFGILAGFNVGVELGQIVAVVAAFGVARLSVRLAPVMARPIWLEAMAGGALTVGIFWFIERSYS